MKHHWLSKFLYAILIAALALAALPVTPARAATITVNVTTDENTNNGNCSLREAIVAANTNAAYNGCPAGAGADTIVLTGGSTYALTINGNGNDGDLDITSAITIQSSNTTLAIIDPGAAFTDRVFQVTNTGTLTLNLIRITTVSSGNDGAVIDNGGGVVSITNSALDNNAATGNNNNGGVYQQNGGSLTVTNSVFNNNSALGDEGGAIYSSGGTVVILNSTFYGNTADLGGAIRVTGGTLNISFSSFSNNTASAGNGGDVHASGGGTNLRIFRSYLVNPVTTTINCFSAAGGVETITSNLVEGNAGGGNACGGAASTAFADTLTLANNGGPTQTLAITSSMTNIYNAAGACTDYNGNAVATDQRGIARPQAGSCDRGAFELAANTAPTTSGIANVAVLEDAANTSIDLWTSFADAEDADNQLTYTVTGNTNPSLFTSVTPPAPGGQYLVLDYAPDANGSSNITVRATDTGGLFVETSFTVTVTAVNDAPSFVKGADQTVNEDAGAQTVNGWATAISAGPTNESGQVLTFNVTGNTNPALFSAAPAVNPANGNLTYTPAANANGSATITITLSDNGGTANGGVDTSAAQMFVITVTPVNDPPLVSDIPNQSVPEGGPFTTINLDNYVSDPDHTDAQMTWTYAGNVELTVSIDASRVATIGIPSADWYGSETITFTAADPGGLSAGDPATFTVNAVNNPPFFIMGGDQTVAEDSGAQTISIWATSISVGPPNESWQTPTFQVTNDNNALFSAQPAINANGDLTYTPAANAHGAATVTVVLRDDGGTANGGVDTYAPSPNTFTITVTPVNDPPFFSSAPLTSVMQNDPYAYNIVTDDPDAADTLTITAPTLPSWLSF
ncbi:MAG: CSLREA domain-containing protein, partial [Chloroflexi bacterium]|nr:CSLREA domain-containing protein [Chloroflexota bacterium]